jgi:hypothetical protein
LSLKNGKYFNVIFGIPKEHSDEIKIDAAPKTLVKPNSSAEKILGNKTMVLIAPKTIPI